MIVITGAAGFIGSNLVAELNSRGFIDLILVDQFNRREKMSNVEGKRFKKLVSRDDFHAWLDDYHRHVQFVIHLGARTDTAEFNWDILEKLNLGYSRKVWEACVKYGLPLIYASSAATYGGGEHGYSDDHGCVPALVPLNPYGHSKNMFDNWVLQQEKAPFYWAGLKFFNVYGPNEYHKGRMASVVFHAFRQISESGQMKLFRSHRAGYADGEQKRDFIYVDDVVDVIAFLMIERPGNGIFNLGTGLARSFNDLAKATFRAMDKQPEILYIDTPEDIRDKYQYFTQAEMAKLRSSGYPAAFTGLEEGIDRYIREYLLTGRYA